MNGLENTGLCINMDIDDILDELIEEEKEENKKTTELVEVKPNTKSVATINTEDQDGFLEYIQNQTESIMKQCDNNYNVFLPEVSVGRDKTSASKEAMTSSIDLKLNALNNLMQAYVKMKSKENQTNVGVFVDTFGQKKAGIDLNKIMEEAN